MPKATKKVAEEAVEKVKAVAEDAKATVKEVAEKAAVKTEEVVEKAKAAAKPRRTKKADTAEKPAAKTKAAKKTAKTAQVDAKVIIELPEKQANADELVSRAKEDWASKGNALDEMKSISLYVNTAEAMVYYVVNDDYLSGSFAI